MNSGSSFARQLTPLKVLATNPCLARRARAGCGALRKKLPSLALLCAWLCANGALLDVVQVFAWARMFSGYAESMSVTAALGRTFDPARKCHLCLGVAAARKSTQDQLPQAVERAAEKLLLAVQQPAAVILAKPTGDWPAALACTAPTRREPVPVPPPRV